MGKAEFYRAIEGRSTVSKFMLKNNEIFAFIFVSLIELQNRVVSELKVEAIEIRIRWKVPTIQINVVMVQVDREYTRCAPRQWYPISWRRGSASHTWSEAASGFPAS